MRSERRWQELFSREDRYWILVRDRGAITGYAAFAYEGELHRPTTLVVHELVAENHEATLDLLSALAAQRDQVDVVELAVALDDPLLYVLQDAPGARRGEARIEHPLGVCGAGPMVRVVDVKRALEARGYAADGRFTVAVTSPETPGLADETFELVVEGGRASAIARSPGTEAAAFTIEREILGSVLASGMKPSDAVRIGAARVRPASSTVQLDALFAGPRFHCLDPF